MAAPDQILGPIRAFLGNNSIRVPAAGNWSLDGDVLTVTLASSRLDSNIQTSGPAVPWFLLALCYWYERATGQRLTGRVLLDGEIPETLHANRARFMLTELAEALPDRLEVVGLRPWRLPDRPVVNAPVEERAASHDRGSREHQLEVALTQVSTPLGQLHRQFPLGLFDGEKSSRTRVFPGNKAQADLWSYDGASRVFRLVELKAGDNRSVGILSEAFTYVRLLQRLVDHPRSTWSATWEGERAARSAARFEMWLVAESFHPLVLSMQDSPLAWLNASQLGLRFGIRYVRPSDGGIDWPEPAWPEAPAS